MNSVIDISLEMSLVVWILVLLVPLPPFCLPLFAYLHCSTYHTVFLKCKFIYSIFHYTMETGCVHYIFWYWIDCNDVLLVWLIFWVLLYIVVLSLIVYILPIKVCAHRYVHTHTLIKDNTYDGLCFRHSKYIKVCLQPACNTCFMSSLCKRNVLIYNLISPELWQH